MHATNSWYAKKNRALNVDQVPRLRPMLIFVTARPAGRMLSVWLLLPEATLMRALKRPPSTTIVKPPERT